MSIDIYACEHKLYLYTIDINFACMCYTEYKNAKHELNQ